MFHVYKIFILLFLGRMLYKSELVKLIIETFRFSISLQYFCLLTPKIESFTEILPIFKLKQKEHIFEMYLNHGSITHYLCVLTLVISPIWASISLSVKWV